jgi:hypothetical protein
MSSLLYRLKSYNLGLFVALFHQLNVVVCFSKVVKPANIDMVALNENIPVQRVIAFGVRVSYYMFSF